MVVFNLGLKSIIFQRLFVMLIFNFILGTFADIVTIGKSAFQYCGPQYSTQLMRARSKEGFANISLERAVGWMDRELLCIEIYHQ